MAGIKQPILDIKTRIATLQVTNGDGTTKGVYVNIWNNQLNYEVSGQLYDFPKPACFIEVINDVQYQQLGGGFQSADVGFRIHVVHEFYDAQDGDFEKNLPVFDLRDSLRALLCLYEPTACGPLVVVAEAQDYQHTNIYHYVIDFVCNFTDSKGSPYDPATGRYIDKDPPTALQVDVSLVDSIPGKENELYIPGFYIPK